MHTMILAPDNGEGEWYAHHSGDFTGDVILYRGEREVARVPFSVLKRLIAGWVTRECIAAYEQASENDVLLGRVKA